MARQLQHYVARFVLRRFCEGDRDAVHVFDKQASRRFVASTGKIGAEKGLYDFQFSGEDLTLERGLSDIEDRAATHIERILRDGRLHLLDPLERGDLARFLAVQLVRTPAHQAMWRELESRMEAYLRREGMREEFFAIDPQLGARENAERVFAAKTMIDAPVKFGGAFVAKDWVLLQADARNPYLIGDHPLVMHNGRDLGPRGNLGVGVRGIEIYFPLSPKFTLGMMCESHRRDFEQALSGIGPAALEDLKRRRGLEIARDFIRAVNSGEPASMDPQHVEFLNSLQIARAERFVFSCHADFSLVETMIAGHPDLRHGARLDEATGKF